MHKRARRFLYYPLLAIFFVATPLLLLYSLGYTFDWRDRSVSKTGGMFIKSRTSRISISLDDEQIKESSFFTGSALLMDIPVGTHVVRLEHDNYHPWTKTVAIKPLEVVELRNIILAPRNLLYATTSARDLPATSTPESTGNVFSLGKNRELISTGQGTTTVLLEHIHSFEAFSNEIYFISDQGFLGRIETIDNTIEALGRPGFYLAKTPARFIRSQRGDIAIIDSSGGLFLITTEKRIIPVDGAVIDARFDLRGDKLLIQKEQELLLLWITENRIQPFQIKSAKETIIKTPSQILQSSWFYQSSAHVAIRTEEGIFLTEIDGRGGRNTHELVPGTTEDFFTSPDDPNSIFFKRNKTWFRTEI